MSLKILFSLILVLMFSSCATVNSLFSKEPNKSAEGPEPDLIKYSDNQNTYNPSNRQYQKMNRQQLEDDSELHSSAGSMWVMDGQGSYLFAQNKMRRDGDLMSVQLEGTAQRQVETKVTMIKKLLADLEAMEKPPGADPAATPAAGLAGAKPAAAPAPARAPAAGEADDKEGAVKVDAVPTRIVEKLPDGNYRVQGQSPFMIGKREYKVVVTGLVRPEDFNDQVPVSSNKLLDPQYDVVSIRRTVE
jgi:flagellar L-ring protein precursor FlgH